MFGMAEHIVGGAIRRSREGLGISLRGLAAAVEVSPATMSAVEHGRTPVTVDRLRDLAAALGTTPEALLRGDVSPHHPRDETSATHWRDYADLTLDPVLDAAARVFVRQGFHAATMRLVAEEAGLSVAGVYHHFPSKQHLIVGLLDVTMTEIRWRLLAARDDGDDDVDSFSLMVESLALFHATRGDLAFLGATEMRALEEPDRSRIVALRNEVQHLLDSQVDRCVRAGHFTVAAPRVASRAVATMCTSLPTWFRSDGSLVASDVAHDYAAYATALMR